MLASLKIDSIVSNLQNIHSDCFMFSYCMYFLYAVLFRDKKEYVKKESIQFYPLYVVLPLMPPSPHPAPPPTHKKKFKKVPVSKGILKTPDNKYIQ